MNKIEAKFKIVTPMFISGADQTKAELRVPSIKGALRFWWRALNYEEDPTNLLKKESAIFGSTDGQSKIKMRLKDVNIPTTKISNKWNINDWRGYIGYGLSEDQSGKEKKSIYRTHINPGGKFSLIINSKEEINSLSDPLKLLSLLGGLGSRSRKGWGSIAIESIDNGWEIPKTRNEYKEQLGQIFVSTGVEELPRYSAISSESDVRVGPIFGDQNSAFEDIGLKYQ